MNCLILIFVIFGGCFGAALKTKSDKYNLRVRTSEKFIIKTGTLFHNSHPSMNGAIREVTDCIAEEALDEAMEGLVIKSYHGIKSNESVQARNKICNFFTENKEIINSFLYCLISSQTEKFRDFITALSLTTEFLIDEFCQSRDITRFPLFMNENSFHQHEPQKFLKSEFQNPHFKPSPDVLCLPARVAQSIEVMVILSRIFPFQLQGVIGNLYHLVVTFIRDIPFKVYNECS